MRILDTFRPSKNQKQVLAKIAGAATPTVAGDAISVGSNTVAARDALIRLGLITFQAGEAALTDTGMQLAVSENIVDEAGGLTAEGQALASATETQPTPESTVPQPPTVEAFSVIRELLR